MMKKMVAVMMAVMAGMTMVACSDTSIADIQPAGIENTIVENIETEKEIVEKIVYVEKERETPVLEGILKITDSNGALKRFMVLTDQGYFVTEYLPDAVELINKTCERKLTISDAFGRFQVSDETGRAFHVQQMIEVE